jgi:hypothetical protein
MVKYNLMNCDNLETKIGNYWYLIRQIMRKKWITPYMKFVMLVISSFVGYDGIPSRFQGKTRCLENASLGEVLLHLISLRYSCGNL